jgi:hypothetical protein
LPKFSLMLIAKNSSTGIAHGPRAPVVIPPKERPLNQESAKEISLKTGVILSQAQVVGTEEI